MNGNIEDTRETRRRMDELQARFSEIGRELEAIRQDTTPGSKADRINALYDEAGEVVTEWQRLTRANNQAEV